MERRRGNLESNLLSNAPWMNPLILTGPCSPQPFRPGDLNVLYAILELAGMLQIPHSWNLNTVAAVGEGVGSGERDVRTWDRAWQCWSIEWPRLARGLRVPGCQRSASRIPSDRLTPNATPTSVYHVDLACILAPWVLITPKGRGWGCHEQSCVSDGCGSTRSETDVPKATELKCHESSVPPLPPPTTSPSFGAL